MIILIFLAILTTSKLVRTSAYSRLGKKVRRRYWVGCYTAWLEQKYTVLAQAENTDLEQCLKLCEYYLYMAIQGDKCWCGNEYATRPEHKRLPIWWCFKNEKSKSPFAVYRTRANKLVRQEPEIYVCVEYIYTDKKYPYLQSFFFGVIG